MARVIAAANQKGGVAKTTTVQSLGGAFAEMGLRTLVVDLDPQACLTFSSGVDPDGLDLSLHDVMLGRATAREVVVKDADVHLLPSTIDLAGAEVHLLSRTGREFQLRHALRDVTDDYDIVLIDCPPSLGILTINGLTAASEVIVPLQCETLGRRGVGQLLETVEDVRSYTNADLHVLGAVATMVDARTKLAQQVIAEIPDRYGIPVLPPPIPKSVRVAEAPATGRSVLAHAGAAKAADAYRALARTILEQAARP